jgi:hypothetical protein
MNQFRSGVVRSCLFALIATLFCAAALAQASAPQAPTTQAPAAAASPSATAPQFDNRILAESDKLIHVNRVKVGDTVTAHLTAPAKMRDGTELPKGSKLVGTITEIKVKADKEGPSKLGLLFTKVVPKSGAEIPVQLALVTVAPHSQQNSVDTLSGGNPSSSVNRVAAGTGNATLNQRSTEGEALSRGLGARAPASKTNVNDTALEPGKSYLTDVVLVSYSMGTPGTVLESKSGSVYIDSGVKMMFLQP